MISARAERKHIYLTDYELIDNRQYFWTRIKYTCLQTLHKTFNASYNNNHNNIELHLS